MNVKHSKKNKLLGILIVLLIICEIASLTVLFNRISPYSRTEVKNIIPLTKSQGATKVTVTTQPKSALSQTSDEPRIVRLASPSFSTYDKDTVWQAETNVNIFRMTYNNSSGEMTVNGASDNSDKLIAPGTSGVYQFALQNTGDVTLDYTMDMEAWITGTELNIPVKARVWNYDGEFLLGSSDTTEEVLALNNVADHGPLGTGRIAVYNLEWEWPYEQDNDEFDTLLGDLAVDGELALTIRINTTAAYNDNPEDEDAGILPPQTGDTTPIHLIMTICGCMIIIASACLFMNCRRENEESDE